MEYINRKASICLVMNLVIICAYVAYAKPEAKPVKWLEEIDARYSSIRTLNAHFEQTYDNRRFAPLKSSGEVSFAIPGKMRWEYQKPTKKLFVSNGTSLISFDYSLNQGNESIEWQNQSIPSALGFLWGRGSLSKGFTISSEEKQKDDVFLGLLPKMKNAPVKEIQLSIDKRRKLIKQVVLIDFLGNRNQIEFRRIRLNKKFKESHFEFTLPDKGILVKPERVRK